MIHFKYLLPNSDVSDGETFVRLVLVTDRSSSPVAEDDSLPSSLEASLIVLVQKKDGSLHFCIDYQSLNSVTKPESHAHKMFYQLGSMKYILH